MLVVELSFLGFEAELINEDLKLKQSAGIVNCRGHI